MNKKTVFIAFSCGALLVSLIIITILSVILYPSSTRTQLSDNGKSFDEMLLDDDEKRRVPLDIAQTEYRKNPNDYLNQTIYGEALLREGNPRDALVVLKIALKSMPQSPEAHYRLGVAYMKNGDLKSAHREWKKVIEITPPVREEGSISMGNFAEKIIKMHPYPK